MSRWTEFQTGLGEADRTLARARMPEDAERRLRIRLQEARRSRYAVLGRLARPVLAAALAGAACAAALVVVRVAFWSPASAPRSVSVAGWQVSQASSDLATRVGRDALLEVTAGACTLVDEAWGSLRVARGARLRREPAGVRLVRGTTEVRVTRRGPGAAPARVLVSHGTILVMGTHFTVVQDDGAGRVSLHQGKIRFLPLDPGVPPRDLAPGESLAWPLPRTSASAAAERRGSPPDAGPAAHQRAPRRTSGERSETRVPPAPEPTPSIGPVLERVAVLRSRGRHREAVHELEQALLTAAKPSSNERLSYELGSILTYQLGDRAAACAHWQRHRRHYPAGGYATEVRQAEQRLGCQPDQRSRENQP